MGRVHNRARDDCFHPAINARTFTCHQDLPAFPHTPASVHADAMLRFASPPHSCRAQPMPAFSALSPRFHSSPPLRWPQSQPRRHTRGVFTCTHVSNGSRYCRWFGGFLRHGIMCTLYSIGRLWVGGVDVGVACRRGGLSNTALSTTRRSRRRRRFPVIKSHACMARGLLVRQSLVIGVFSLIGHTTSIRAVVCLRLPVAIYVLFDAPCLQTLLWMYAVHIYSIYWYACGSITAC